MPWPHLTFEGQGSDSFIGKAVAWMDGVEEGMAVEDEEELLFHSKVMQRHS